MSAARRAWHWLHHRTSPGARSALRQVRTRSPHGIGSTIASWSFVRPRRSPGRGRPVASMGSRQRPQPAAGRKEHRHGRPHGGRHLPREAPGDRVPVLRDLRRVPLLLGLRPARRGAQAQHQARLVALDGAAPRRRSSGLDAAILMSPKVWEASGHVAAFTDPLVDCRLPRAVPRRPPAASPPRRARTAAARAVHASRGTST